MLQDFGRYHLADLLGRGGMGEVYRAFDTVRQRTVALKLLPTDLAHDEMYKARFRRESLLAARLNEPHIIPIHDFGEIDGRLFLDMRLVEGTDLGKAIASHGRFPPAVAVDIVIQIGSALDSAHENGLVHRDVKPSNVLLTAGLDQPFAYLVDFGIARSVAAGSTALTAPSSTVGTFAYMAPERLMGEQGDPRSDIYALACVLFESLTGQRPFDGDLPALMYAHMNLVPPRASAIDARIPPAIDHVIAKGMAKNPDDRYAKASELAQAARAALNAAPSGANAVTAGPSTIIAPPTYSPPGAAYQPSTPPTPPPRRKLWLLITAVVAVAAAVAATVLLVRNHGSPQAAQTTPATTPAAPSTGASVTAVAACEVTHGLSQAAMTVQQGPVSIFKSCSAPAAAGADSDGFLTITAYTLSTTLPESSGMSEYDFIVGPCTTFRLAYSFASQGASEILPAFTVDQGAVTMEGSEGSPFSFATADPALSVIPNPATGQAVYLHSGRNIINQASCAKGGSAPAAVPPQILSSASATH